MPTFTDKHGREWRFKLTRPIARAVEALPDYCNVTRFAPGFKVSDLLSTNRKKLAAAIDLLTDHPEAVAPLVWLLCRQQWPHRDVTEWAFCDGLEGDTLPAMTAALLESIETYGG